jgi:site-specific DNA-methyltransferase (adenine-specific)
MSSVVYNEDCMAVMKRYPDNHFDLAIVDPPYGLNISALSNYGESGGTDKRWNTNKKDFYKPKEWDKNIPTAEYFEQLKRVSKNQIVWGWNYYVSYFNDCPSYIVWNKEASGNYSDCEMAWCSIKGTNKIFKWLWNGFRKQQPEERIHPTQKPVALYEWILANYAKPNDLILDTHLGSGSSRIAAYKGGFNFVGCELDKEYFEAQEKRFKQFKSQLTLAI